MLVKLVYFAELEHWRRFGEPLTGTPFRLHHYGAFAPEVVWVAEEADQIEHSHFQGWFNLTHNYKLRDEGTGSVNPIPVIIEQLIQEVVSKYGSKSADEVGRLSKETEPMRAAVPERRLDFSLAAPRQPGLRVRSDRLASAQSSLDLSRRGSPAELAARDEAELAAWAPARRRAAQNGMSSSA